MNWTYILSDEKVNGSSCVFCESVKLTISRKSDEFINSKNFPFFVQLFKSLPGTCQSHIARCPQCFLFLAKVAEAVELFNYANRD